MHADDVDMTSKRPPDTPPVDVLVSRQVSWLAGRRRARSSQRGMHASV